MSYQHDSIPDQEKIQTSGAPAIQVAQEVTEGVTTEILSILGAESICEYIGEDKLRTFESELHEGIAKDKQSMTSYLASYKRAINLAKMEPEHKDKTFPFVGASNLMSPYVMEAAMEFSARATPMLLERRDICKIDIQGADPTGEKKLRGERVASAINQDLRYNIEGWRDNQDKALLLLAIVGTYFKKTYQCGFENKRKSELIHPDKLIFDHSSDRFESAPRKSYEYRMRKNEVLTAIRTGEFLDIDLETYYKDEDEICFVESHCWLDLDDDGYSEPYIVNIEKSGQGRIVSIEPRFDEDDILLNEDNEVAKITEENFFTQTIFIPDPTGSCMGIGWGVLLGDTFEAINTHMRQLTDAGTLQNISANSGFIKSGSVLSGNRQKKGNIKMQMGQFTSLETGGTGPLSNDIAQFPFAGPSQTLYTMMEGLKAEVRQMTSSSQVMEGHAGEAAELYLARLQQAMITPNSIMIRVFSGVTKELKRVYEIMGKYLGQEAYINLVDDPEANWDADFAEDYDICTTADPSQGSEQERLARNKIVYEMAMTTPAMDARLAATAYLDSLGVKNVEELLPPPQPEQPDPLVEQQMQVMQTMSEAEKVSSDAKMIASQARMMDSQIAMYKVDSEIQKLEAESLKILSDVDKNSHDAKLKELKESRESFKLHFENNMKVLNDYQTKRSAEDATRRNPAMAERGAIQSPSRSPSPMQGATMPRIS